MIFNNSEDMDALSAYCGRDYTQMQDLLLKWVGFVDALLEVIINELKLISCKTIVPLYVETVYFGMCTYSPDAVYWVFKVSNFDCAAYAFTCIHLNKSFASWTTVGARHGVYE